MPDDEFQGMVSHFKTRMAEVARLQAECAQIVATGTAERRRVRVTVNADGIAVDIRFTAEAADLSYDEIAAAVTEASRAAVLEVAARRKELLAPLLADRPAARLDDLTAGLRALRDGLR